MNRIENKINRELNETVLHSYPLELSEKNRFLILCEEHSIPTVTNAMVRKIARYCQNLVDNHKLGMPLRVSDFCKEYKIIIPENFLNDIYDNFISQLYCEIQLIIFNKQDAYYNTLKKENSGAYDHTKHSNKLTGVRGAEKLDRAFIQVRCFALKDEVYHSILYTLIHEFNHCYEDYMRLLYGKDTFQQWLEKTKYIDNMQTFQITDNQYVQDLCFILYNISPTEVNAKIAQMYGELSNGYYQNSIFASNAIKNTIAYQIIVKCYNYFNELKNITNTEEQKLLLRTFTLNSQKHFSIYWKMLEYLENQLDIVKKTIFIKAAKNIDRINQEYLANPYKS